MFTGHDLGTGVQGDVIAERSEASDKAGGVDAEKVSDRNIMPQDRPGLHKEEVADFSVGSDISVGRDNSSIAEGGVVDLCLWMNTRGKDCSPFRERLDALAADGILPDAAEEWGGERCVLNRADNRRIVGVGVKSMEVVINKADGIEPGLLSPPEEFSSEPAGSQY